MAERINPIPKKLRPAIYTVVAFGGLAAAACGGKVKGQESTPPPFDNTPGVERTVVPPSPTAAPTVKVEPTAVPTEAPKALKTILDQPVVKTDMQSIRKLIEPFYGNYGIITFADEDKLFLDRYLNSCEKGDSPGANSKEIAAEREAGCFLVIRRIYDVYKSSKFVNRGEPVDGLWQIALAVRNYFDTQYPERRDRFESSLRTAGIN